MQKLAFQDLALFHRVAALSSLSAVAREWGVPASQISRALVRIEDSCRARLVRRSTHGLSLTAEGELFLHYCSRIVGTVEELEAEFHACAGHVSGLVRVAASSVVSKHLLLDSLSDLGAQHPQLQVALVVSDQTLDMARDGIDIAIRTSTAPPETLVARRLGHLGRALYASPVYAARAGLPTHPAELGRHQLVTHSAATHLNRWAFKVENQPWNHLAEGRWQCNDSGMAMDMVLQGLGIGRLATIAAEPLVRQQRLLPVLADVLDDDPIPIYAMTASARQRLPRIRACVDFWAQRLAAVPASGRTQKL